MPRQKKASKGLKSPLQIEDREIQSQNDLEAFIKEASEVKILTQQNGWAILERDLNHYRREIGKRIAYLNPKRPEFNEARVLYLAADKIISMVNDYQDNRDIAIELLQKMENPDLAITMDIDNE